MDPSHFLITGCGRSGTTYTSLLFTAIGIPCTREVVFTPDTIASGNTYWPSDVPGEAAWEAAAFLMDLPPRTAVLHQVRHPLDVVRSFHRMHFFHEATEYPTYRRFTEVCFPELAEGAPLERCLRYWLLWNRLAESAAHIEGVRYVRYRLEDLNEDTVLELTRWLGRPRERDVIRHALSTVPRNSNTRGDKTEDAALGWSDLPQGQLLDGVRELAEAYGYGDPVAPGAPNK